MSINIAIVPVAGQGTSVLPLTKSQPKEMLAVGREPNLAELDYERQNIEYFYTRQRRQLGLGHAVLCAQPLIGREPAVVALGDSIIGRNGDSRIV